MENSVFMNRQRGSARSTSVRRYVSRISREGTLGALVGVGRVRGGKHHPSDVVAGWAVGVASGILVPLVHAHVPDNVDIGVGPGSVAVTVTL